MHDTAHCACVKDDSIHDALTRSASKRLDSNQHIEAPIKIRKCSRKKNTLVIEIYNFQLISADWCTITSLLYHELSYVYSIARPAY